MPFFVLRNTDTQETMAVEATDRGALRRDWMSNGQPYLFDAPQQFGNLATAQDWITAGAARLRIAAAAARLQSNPVGGIIGLAKGQADHRRNLADEADATLSEADVAPINAEADRSQGKAEGQDAEEDGKKPSTDPVNPFKDSTIVPADEPRKIGETVWGKDDKLSPSEAEKVKGVFERADTFVDTDTDQMAKRNEDVLADSNRTAPRSASIVGNLEGSSSVSGKKRRAQWGNSDDLVMGPDTPSVPEERVGRGWERLPKANHIREFYQDYATAKAVAIARGGRAAIAPNDMAVVSYPLSQEVWRASDLAQPEGLLRAEYDGRTFLSRKSLQSFLQNNQDLPEGRVYPQTAWTKRPRRGYVTKSMRSPLPGEVEANEMRSSMERERQRAYENIAFHDEYRENRSGIDRPVESNGFEPGDNDVTPWELQRATDLVEDRMDGSMYGGSIDSFGYKGGEEGGRSSIAFSEVRHQVRTERDARQLARRRSGVARKVRVVEPMHPFYDVKVNPNSILSSREVMSPANYADRLARDLGGSLDSFKLSDQNRFKDATHGGYDEIIGYKITYDQDATSLIGTATDSTRLSRGPLDNPNRRQWIKIIQPDGSVFEGYIGEKDPESDKGVIRIDGPSAWADKPKTSTKVAYVSWSKSGRIAVRSYDLDEARRIRDLMEKRGLNSDIREGYDKHVWEVTYFNKELDHSAKLVEPIMQEVALPLPVEDTIRPNSPAYTSRTLTVDATGSRAVMVPWERPIAATVYGVAASAVGELRTGLDHTSVIGGAIAVTHTTEQALHGPAQAAQSHLFGPGAPGKLTQAESQLAVAYTFGNQEANRPHFGPLSGVQVPKPYAGSENARPYDSVDPDSGKTPEPRHEPAERTHVCPRCSGKGLERETMEGENFPKSHIEVPGVEDGGHNVKTMPCYACGGSGMVSDKSAKYWGASTGVSTKLPRPGSIHTEQVRHEIFPREEQSKGRAPIGSFEQRTRTVLGAIPGSHAVMGHIGRAAVGWGLGALGGAILTMGQAKSSNPGDQMELAAEGALWGAMGSSPRAALHGLRSHAQQETRDEINAGLASASFGFVAGGVGSAAVEHHMARRGSATAQLAGFAVGTAAWAIAEIGRSVFLAFKARAQTAAVNTVGVGAVVSANDHAQDLAESAANEFEVTDLEFHDESGDPLEIDFDSDERDEVSDVTDDAGDAVPFEVETLVAESLGGF